MKLTEEEKLARKIRRAFHGRPPNTPMEESDYEAEWHQLARWIKKKFTPKK